MTDSGLSLSRLTSRMAGTLVAALALAASATSAAAWSATAGYDPATDVNSMASTAQYLGAQAWWSAGYTGRGVDVAVIDSGVSPVDGLNDAGKVVYGPDLSLDARSPNLRNADGYGHGTFMAGLIAGRGADYRGIAPDARIISLKVATADGGVDVSQVIAAIDWVVQHAHDPGLNIRVINLSYGTNSRQAYTDDPLAYAAEQAWKHGIVVVAAAGNSVYQRGYGAVGIADPAYDPFVLAVGASDSMGTLSQRDDAVASFTAGSNGCGNCKNSDLLAPGAHIQGLAVPGSWIDVHNPEGRLDGGYFRGSGTSEATAIMSGAVALVLQKYPTLTPDLVKRFFVDDAGKLARSNAVVQGAGEIRLGPMLADTPEQSSARQDAAPSTGTGSLDASRGTDRIMIDGVLLRGERDVFGGPVDTSALAAAEATASAWSGTVWNGSSWLGSSWSGSSWSGSSWSGASWSGASWSGASWSSSSWG